ncbi:MAG: GDSL-type esterase/lipase family protein [Oscillospiraceae bacterium]|nr:GDSL-type esterase/lipase family protein [Oscillospiraceae bacterium]
MKKIICFGDSNTSGYDPSDPLGGRYPEHQRWTTLLEKLSEVPIINCGMEGRCVPQKGREAEAELQVILSQRPFDGVVLMLGTNDIINSAIPNTQKIAARMENFVRMLQAAEPSARILIIAPPGIEGYGLTVFQNTVSLADRYRRMARNLGIEYADATEWNLKFAYDGIHLTPEANRVFAEKVAAALGIRK